jgi:Putative nucleotidyltransferase DUF294
VDSGSAAQRPIADPAGALEQLPDAPLRLRPLLDARSLTEDSIVVLRRRLERITIPERCCLTLFGSWGRGELTGESDVDWALIVDDPRLEPDDPDVTRAVDSLRRTIDKGPGRQGIFGGAFHAHRLVENIGLHEDDSANITRRLLLLLESVPITSPDLHRGLKRRVLDRYLSGHSRSYRPPRFLLNDVIRYWRTIAVDFEGKVEQDRRAGDAEGFVLRNAKLRTSRKMLYISGLLPALLCHYVEAEDMMEFLEEQLSAVATDRVARAFLHLGLDEAGARTLGAYSDWLALLSDPTNRASLEALTAAARHRDPVFAAVRNLGSTLDNGFLALLYESPLGPVAQRFVTL